MPSLCSRLLLPALFAVAGLALAQPGGQAQLHAGAMHGPTPASIPGGQVITTQGLVELLQGRRGPFVVVDVLGQPEMLPGSASAPWLAQPGTFDDEVQGQARQWLAQLTQGRRDVALVFYCLSRECWLSYNASLRAIRAGFTNVLWYRGGLEAWKAAGLPTQGAMAGGYRPVPGMPLQPTPANGRSGPFAAVRPATTGAAAMPAAQPDASPASLSIGRGRHFAFALPQGWRVGEEGQFAVVLHAPDDRAMTLVVGNSGLPMNHSPARFVHDKLAAMRVRDLSIGPPRPAAPAAGLAQGFEFDVAYVAGSGMPVRGVAKLSQAGSYDSKVMVVTAALAAADQWPQYVRWLPAVAEQVSALDGAAFGRRGVMAQNLNNSIAFGEAARQYREWSQRNWQGVVDQRNASVDRRSAEFRENLGAVQAYANPYGGAASVELSTQYAYYWMDRQGLMVGTNDPGADPNVGSTGEWRRMEQLRR